MAAAISIQQSASSELKLFPENCLLEESKAKQDIWENWSEFSDIMISLETDATGLLQVGGNGVESSAIAVNQFVF